MERSLRTILIVFFHVTLIVIAAFPYIYLKFAKVKSYQRGFYCDDESIRYPYKKSTVTMNVTMAIGLTISLVTIILTEFFHSRESFCEQSKSFRPIPKVVVNIYKYCGIFTFGFFANQTIVYTSKFLIGRLRPHFISACNLDFSKVDCTNHNYVMINNTFCRQTDPKILKDMRLSFPSGHSSFSAYCAVALTIYLMRRWMMKGRWTLIRVFYQALVILMAILLALSRVSDYKHHATDVLAGFTLGVLVGLSVWTYLLDTTTKILTSNEHVSINPKESQEP